MGFIKLIAKMIFAVIVAQTIAVICLGEYNINVFDNPRNCFPPHFFVFDLINYLGSSIAENMTIYVIFEISIIGIMIFHEKIQDYIYEWCEKKAVNNN